MKCHYADAFCAALINSQPMGFYVVAQIVGDARKHGVEIRPVCINRSRWDCTLEPVKGDERGNAVRLGMRLVRGLAALDVAKTHNSTHLATIGEPHAAAGLVGG